MRSGESTPPIEPLPENPFPWLDPSLNNEQVAGKAHDKHVPFGEQFGYTDFPAPKPDTLPDAHSIRQKLCQVMTVIGNKSKTDDQWDAEKFD
jgi:hypothetical protein